MDAPDSIRIDKWLWAARFFRHRKLATDALKQGKVQCNGVRPKPSRAVRLGDRLRIEKGEQSFEIEVTGLSEQRGPASQAQQLYRETEASTAARQEQTAQRRAARLSAPQAPLHRPDKHARQRIRRLLGK